MPQIDDDVYASVFGAQQNVPPPPKADPTVDEMHAAVFGRAPDPVKPLGVYVGFTNKADAIRQDQLATELKRYLGPDTPPVSSFDLQSAERQLQIAQADHALRSSPYTAKWAQDRVATGHDPYGLDALSKIEKAWDFLGKSGRHVVAGGLKGVAGWAAAPAALTENLKPLSAFFPALGVDTLRNAIGLVPDALFPEYKAAEKEISLSTSQWLDNLAGTIATPITGEDSRAERVWFGGMESIGQFGVSLGTAALTKRVNANAVAGLMSASVFGSTYRESYQEYGDHDRATLHGALDATWEFFFEKYGGTGALLDKKTWSNGMLRGILEFAKKEIPSEIYTTVMQKADDYLLNNDERGFGQFLQELPDDVIDTALTTIVAGGGQIGLVRGLDRLAQRLSGKAEADAQETQFTELFTAMQASEVLQNAPDSFSQFFQDMAADQTVRIEAPLLRQAAQKAGVDLDALPSLKEQGSLPGEIELPASELVLAFAGKGGEAAIIPHLRLDPEDMTIAEKREAAKNAIEEMGRIGEEAVAAKAKDEVFTRAFEGLVEEITADLWATGKYGSQQTADQARFVATTYAVTAGRLGITPLDLWNGWTDSKGVKHRGYRIRGNTEKGAVGEQVLEQRGMSLADVKSGFDAAGVEHSVFEKGDLVTLSQLVVPKDERKKGVGTKAMQTLVEYADQGGKTIALSPSTDFGATSKARLVAFYKRFGFVENKGKNKDHTISESMYRPPDPTLKQSESQQERAITALAEELHASGKNTLFQKSGFYSPLSRAFENAKQEAAPAQQWASWLQANKAKIGLKDDEIQFSGILDYLDLRGKDKVTKAEIADYLSGSGVKVEDVVKGKASVHVSPNPDEPNILEVYRADDPTGEFAGMVGEIIEDGGKYSINVPELPRKTFATLQEAKDFIADNSGLGSTTKFAGYWESSYKGGIPGTYREILVTLPTESRSGTDADVRARFDLSWAFWEGASDTERRIYRREYTKATGGVERDGFKSSHWDEPNVLVHVRTDEVRGADGKRYLRVGEIQSDWGQKGKKDGFGGNEPTTAEIAAKVEELKSAGYISERDVLNPSKPSADPDNQGFKVFDGKNRYGSVSGAAKYKTEIEAWERVAAAKLREEFRDRAPTAPFVTDTKAWVALGVKRAIMHAMDVGADGVVFGTGQQNADLYDLSKQVDNVYLGKRDDGNYDISVHGNGDVLLEEFGVPLSRVEDVVGKDLAKRAESQTVADDLVKYQGEDLKVGGEGMRAFYDKIVPSVANDVLRKVGGGKVGAVDVEGGQQPGFPITPEMREKMASGMPLFQEKGSVTRGLFNPETLDYTLLADADLSTFLHEMGHFYLTMYSDLATQVQERVQAGEEISEGEQTILDDTVALLRWMGVKPLRMSPEYLRAQAEGARAKGEELPPVFQSRMRYAELNQLQETEALTTAERGELAELEASPAELLQSWNSMIVNQQREAHEKFAETWEQYLITGKAPTPELAGLMERISKWMTTVYMSLKAFLRTRGRADLNPEVEAIIGRMLASNAAIAEAEAARGMEALFKDAAAAGMTPEKFAQYLALPEEARADAERQLRARSMRDLKWLQNRRNKTIAGLQADAKGKRAEVRAEVASEVAQQPVYRAMRWLKRGEYTNPTTGEEIKALQGHKLSLPVLKEMFPLKSVKPAAPAAPVFTEKARRRFIALLKERGGVDMAEASDVLGETGLQAARAMPGLFRKDGLALDAVAEYLVAEEYLTPAQYDDVDGGVESVRELIRAAVDGEFVGTLREQDTYAELLYLDDPGDVPVDDVPDNRVDWRKLGYGRYGMFAEEGIHPDLLADMFGYRNGRDLVQALVEAPKFNDEVEGLTDRRMLEKYGELATPEGLAKAADEAIYNDVRAHMLATELAALATHLGSPSAIMKAAKAYAKAVVDDTVVKRLRGNSFAAQAARAAKSATAAWVKGGSGEAANFKRTEVINHVAAKEAYAAEKEVRDIVAKLRKIAAVKDDSSSAKTRDMDVVNAVRYILSQFEFGTTRKGESAKAYLDAVKRNNPEMGLVLEDLVDTTAVNAKPWDELKVSELRELADVVAGVWSFAKTSQQIEIDGKKLARADVVAELKARMEELGATGTKGRPKHAVTAAEERGMTFATLKAQLRRVSDWAEAKDGGKDIGPFRRYIWFPIKDAADAYRSETTRLLKKYRDLLKGVAPTFKRETIDAYEIGYVFGHDTGLFGGAKDGIGIAELLHAILHTGNESNKRKLLLGYGWAGENADGTVNTSKWDTFIKRMQDEGRLTKVHYDFVQGVWDLLEETKPAAQKAHRAVFGKYFEEITADALKTPFGEYRGGYVPAMADPRRSQDAELRKLSEQENENLAYAFPSPARGFTKSRVEYNRPLMLDLRTLAGHIDKVVLFSHLAQPVADVRRVLMDKGFSGALEEIDPAALPSLLTPWLNRAAKQVVETRSEGAGNLGKFWSVIRTRAGMAAMFGNVVNTMQQFTGVFTAAVKVPPKYLIDAQARYFRHPVEMTRFVRESSKYMDERLSSAMSHMSGDVHDILLDPSVYDSTVQWLRRHTYFMQQAVDSVMTPVIWMGAFNQAKDRGLSDLDARRLADDAVRQTQGSQLAEEIANFEAGSPFWRMFTQFAGYFNTQANMLGTEFIKVARDMGLRDGAGRGLYVFVFGLLAPAMVSELIVQAFRGGPDDDDKDGEYLDDWLAALGFGTLRYTSAMAPGLGQTVNALANTFNHKPYDDRISTAPAISMIESGLKAPISVYKAIAEDAKPSKAITDTATAVSMALGVPARTLAKPLAYIADVNDGRIDPTSDLDFVRGTITGVASPESK